MFAKTSGTGYLPTVDTVFATETVSLGYMHWNNKSAGAAICSVKDRSTNCGGGTCTLFGPISVGASGSAGSIISWDFRGEPAVNGAQWSCDTASAVVGFISWQ